MPPPHSVVDRTRLTCVVLATCHRDHDPTNNEAANLAALSASSATSSMTRRSTSGRRLTYFTQRALSNLFTGPYADRVTVL